MFRSRAVAYVKPSSSCRTVLILGMGNGFLTICLFISLKLLTTCMVLSFFGMMKVGKAHSESACHFKTPQSHSLWISFLRSPHAFLVLGTFCHGMVVLLLLVGARPDYNPRHPVFRRTAPQILVGASASCSLLLHWGDWGIPLQKLPRDLPFHMRHLRFRWGIL